MNEYKLMCTIVREHVNVYRRTTHQANSYTQNVHILSLYERLTCKRSLHNWQTYEPNFYKLNQCKRYILHRPVYKQQLSLILTPRLRQRKESIRAKMPSTVAVQTAAIGTLL